jgi:hypothetical protein
MATAVADVSVRRAAKLELYGLATSHGSNLTQP